MIDSNPERIIWCYGIYQPAYDEILKSLPNNNFIKGVSSDLESMLDPSIRNIVVLDDLMQELSNDQQITSLFTKGCHHRNLSVIFIIQNIFHRGNELRDMSLNCHYLVWFKSPRDSSEITHLAEQMFPGHTKFMQESFQDATKKPYGYLLCNLKPETPNDFCLRINIFPGEMGRLSMLTSERYKKTAVIENQLSMAQRLRKNHDFLKLLQGVIQVNVKRFLSLQTTFC